MDSIISVQNNNFSGKRKELTKVLGVDDETKSHLYDNSQNLAKPVKTYLGIIVCQHVTVQRQMVLPKEQYA